MTVTMITTIKNYIGLSTDTKPTMDTPPGSTFWAYDTNILFKTHDGTNWLPYDIKSIVLAAAGDIHQAAATYDLYVATGGTIYVENFSLTNGAEDCSDDGAPFTGISVQTDTTTVIILITAVQGAKANLTPGAVFTYATPFALPVGKKIQYTVIGGSAAVNPTPFTVSCRYQAVTPAGYLA
jgi:hypothetical protein